jgi:hypothetical protein
MEGRKTMLKRNAPIAIAVCMLLAATSVAAVAQNGEESEPPGDGVAQIAAIEPPAEEAMAVLEEPRTGSDALPTGVAEGLDEEADFGMNPDLSRRSIGNATSSLYVIPADDHVCPALTVGDGMVLSCPETEDIAAGEAGPGTVTLPGGAIGIYGLVPDGVESVTLHTGEADAEVVGVTDNGYYVAVPEGTVLRSVSFSGPSGPVEFPIYDPALAFEEEG